MRRSWKALLVEERLETEEQIWKYRQKQFGHGERGQKDCRGGVGEAMDRKKCVDIYIGDDGGWSMIIGFLQGKIVT